MKLRTLHTGRQNHVIYLYHPLLHNGWRFPLYTSLHGRRLREMDFYSGQKILLTCIFVIIIISLIVLLFNSIHYTCYCSYVSHWLENLLRVPFSLLNVARGGEKTWCNSEKEWRLKNRYICTVRIFTWEAFTHKMNHFVVLQICKVVLVNSWCMHYPRDFKAS